jgi:cobalamin biosynthesis protein CobD/CbiB
LQSAAAKAWYVIDWLPARLTALSFAMVGSFEEAIDNWRVYAQRFPNDNDGVILAATAGAINVRLGARPCAAAMRLTVKRATMHSGRAAMSLRGESRKWLIFAVWWGWSGVRSWSGFCCWPC